MAQLVGVSSTHQKVVGSIPGQGTCLGCELNTWSGLMQEATNRCCSFSLSFPPSSLSKINNMSLGEDLKLIN